MIWGNRYPWRENLSDFEISRELALPEANWRSIYISRPRRLISGQWAAFETLERYANTDWYRTPCRSNNRAFDAYRTFLWRQRKSDKKEFSVYLDELRYSKELQDFRLFMDEKKIDGLSRKDIDSAIAIERECKLNPPPAY